MTLITMDWRTALLLATSIALFLFVLSWVLRNDERSARLTQLIKAWRGNRSRPHH
jgi:hypothetical protein